MGESTVFLIVTWVMLREINKYELETCYGIQSKSFMSWDFAQDVTFGVGAEFQMTSRALTLLHISIQLYSSQSWIYP